MNSPTAKTQVKTTTGQRQGDTENPVTKGETGYTQASKQAVLLLKGVKKQNKNLDDIKIEDISEEKIEKVIKDNALGVKIKPARVVDNISVIAENSAVAFNISNIGEEAIEEVVDDARNAVTNTVPKSRACSCDCVDTACHSLHRNCSCMKVITIALIVIVVVIFASSIHVASARKLDFIARKPGEKKQEDEEEIATDKQIVAIFNEAAAAYGEDVSKPYTLAEVQVLLKEAHEWMHMSEAQWWKTQPARNVPEDQRLTTEKLLFQLLVLSAFSPLAFQLMALRPSSWTWIDPKDGVILSAVLSTIYRDEGVEAMYDYIGAYKYYGKQLPRLVAIDAVVASLTHLLPKEKTSA